LRVEVVEEGLVVVRMPLEVVAVLVALLQDSLL
jgi:hypothetical protein